MVKQADDLYAMRHSLAHIMATAVQRLWPDAKFGVGPVVENGFYYDIDLGDKTISEEDFKNIQKEMRKIIKEDQAFERSTKPVDDAIAWAKEAGQPYKQELLNDLKREGTTSVKDIDASQLGAASESSEVDEVSFYTNGDFTDLCRGPHVESTGKTGAFTLTKVAGAYWRGDKNNAQMQRLYGVAFANQADLDAYLERVKQAEERDHRKLGKELGLFTSSELVGSGLPLFTPKGAWLRHLLERYSQQLKQQRGFERVWIPHMTKKDLYETSGHWAKFGDELFLVTSQETSDELVLKPMNCPHHTQIYAAEPRSYRDMPLRFMENTTVYRDEKSGELHGLSRVRSITQDDSHVFCRQDQIEDEVISLIEAAQEMYRHLELDLKFRLSFRDEGEGYLGDAALWEQAQEKLEQIVKKKSLEYYVEEGEAAFYGPKIDFIAVDALSREWQVATVQLDFVQPGRFELVYTDSDGSQQTPVMIHAAQLGSVERFLSVYIEHTAGHFPFWLAPEQVRILQINDSVQDYVAEITTQLQSVVLEVPLKYNEVRFTTDTRNESLGKKIREAEVNKIPVIIIVGPRDAEAGTVSVRTKDGEQTIKKEELVGFLKEQ